MGKGGDGMEGRERRGGRRKTRDRDKRERRRWDGIGKMEGKRGRGMGEVEE